MTLMQVPERHLQAFMTLLRTCMRRLRTYMTLVPFPIPPVQVCTTPMRI
jgi:hypothetical protein